MGTVYLAVKESSNKTVALKIIFPETENNNDLTRLFVREASVVSQLKHRRIVQFYDFGQHDGQLYLSMEYVKEISFTELIKKRDPEKKIRLACGIICQVLDGLSYIHQHSLVHRDIKPSNILLTIQNKKPEVKISDFGLAKNYSIAGFSGITEDGKIRGTLFYMPPEQILNSRDVEPSADIYAAGATLYNYLSEKKPYDQTTDTGIQTFLQEDIIPLDERILTLPDDLVEIVHKALEKEPQRRFQTAKEMHRALLPFTRYRK